MNSTAGECHGNGLAYSVRLEQQGIIQHVQCGLPSGHLHTHPRKPIYTHKDMPTAEKLLQSWIMVSSQWWDFSSYLAF